MAGKIASGQSGEDEKEIAGSLQVRTECRCPRLDVWLSSPHSFTIRLKHYKAKLAERVIQYNRGCRGEWGDNKTVHSTGWASIVLLLLRCPSLLSMSPAHNRRLALRPPQLTRTRSYSSSFPPDTPSFNEQEHERMFEKGLGTPTAAYLSEKLNNYIAPLACSSSSMMTPPTMPPGTVWRHAPSSPPTTAGSPVGSRQHPNNVAHPPGPSSPEKTMSPSGTAPCTYDLYAPSPKLDTSDVS